MNQSEISFLFVLRFMGLVYLVAAIGFAVYPVLGYMIYKEYFTMLTLYIPFVPLDNFYGYLLTVGFHVYLLVVAVAGILVYDAYFMSKYILNPT